MTEWIRVIAVLFGIISSGGSRQPPHIILILADDLGWNDVGFHGSDEIPTPNIDALAYNGVILNNLYAQSICSASRAALLTGKYPIHLGVQHGVVGEAEPWGLGLEEKLLPEWLNDAGYASHAVGKWHLGFFKRAYTPVYRGFQSHFGFWQGFQSYYGHTVDTTIVVKNKSVTLSGYDMRRNMNVAWNARGHYSTDLFTREAVDVIASHNASRPLFLYLAHLAPHSGGLKTPYSAPDDAVAKFRYIVDPRRRLYAAMVSKLDDSVGQVVGALRSKRMLENSVVVFMSDNGAPTFGEGHVNSGSNYPLRGMKISVWEGGHRVPAAVWSPLIKKSGRVSTQLMHVTDWLPTLYSLTGRNKSLLKNIDGVDLWNALSTGKPSPRKHMVYNIDEEMPNANGAIRDGFWKYVAGTASWDHNDGWYGHDGRNLSVKYDAQAVLDSQVEIIISSFWTMKRIDSPNASSSGIPPSLSPGRIASLRSLAEIKCSPTPVVPCNAVEFPCLFNLKEDPCERVNLADTHYDILQRLEDILERYQQGYVPLRKKPADNNADPSLGNRAWSPWMDEVDSSASPYMAEIVVGSVLAGICLLIFAFSSRICRWRRKAANDGSVAP